MESDSLAVQLLERFEGGFSRQANFRSRWNDAATYIMPSKGGITVSREPGAQQTTEIYDSTANEAALVMAGGLISSLVPAGELWFRLTAKPNASPEAAQWLDDCTHRMAAALHASNFYLGIHEDFLDMAAFSVSALFVEEGRQAKDGHGAALNFTNIPVGTFVIEEDADAKVDAVFRQFEFTARQAEQRWGRDVLSKSMCDALDSKDTKQAQKKFKMLHAVYPRAKEDVKNGPTVPKRRPVASVYVDVEARRVIENGGYYEMPAACARFLRGNNEIYGRGPSDQVMPEIKLANRIRRDLLLAIEKTIDPGWLAPEDSSSRVDNRPGGVTYYDASNPANKPERLDGNIRIDYAQQELSSARDTIRRAFFVDMFQMLSNPEAMKREKTAFEVAQLLQEKLVLFHPIFARLVQEKLNPVLERVFNVLLRAGYFLPPPVIDGETLEYEIDYVSKIALAIKAAQNGSVATMMEMVAQMAQFDPTVAMVVNWQAAVRLVNRNLGVPAEIIRSQEEVAEMVQAQEQAAAAAQAMQAADAAAKGARAAKDLGPEAQRQAVEALSQGARR